MINTTGVITRMTNPTTRILTHFISILLLVLAFTLTSCGKSDEEATDTTTLLSGINPPGKIDTLTGDSELELWFGTGNVEKDFIGYMVFTAKSEGLKHNLNFPSQDLTIRETGAAWCIENTHVLEKFGLPAATWSCTNNESPEIDETTVFHYVPCLDDKDTALSDKLSLPVVDESLGTQVCRINQFWADGALTNMENGTTYSLIIVAVTQGEEEESQIKISVSSTLVEDTPSKTALAETKFSLERDHYLPITFNEQSFAVEVGNPLFCGDIGTEEDPCSFVKTNDMAPGENPTVYLGRMVQGNYKQRIVLSTSNQDRVQIQMRGPQFTNKYDGSTNIRIPGDAPAAVETYPQSGGRIVIYEHHIIDFAIHGKSGNNASYGKLYFGDVSFDPADSSNGTANMNLTAVWQPGSDILHYLEPQ